MASFDLSTTNVILTVAVVGLFTFFIVLLMKLNPSTEKKESFKTEIEVERQTPRQTLPITPQSPIVPQHQPTRIEASRVAEKPLIAVGPTMGGQSVQTRQATPVPARAPSINQGRETPRPPEKAAAPARTEAFRSRQDCMHHFGYLRTFPKNLPIPDECFGCEKIVDCLVNNSKKSNGKR